MRRSTGSDVGSCPQPDRATLERSSLVLAHAAPDARVLAAVDGPPKAVLDNGAAAAHLLGFFDLEERRTAVSDREEQLRIYLTTGGNVAPVHDVHSFSASRLVMVRSATRHSVLVKDFTSYAICRERLVIPDLLGVPRSHQGISRRPDAFRRVAHPCEPRSCTRGDASPGTNNYPLNTALPNARGRGKGVLRISCQIDHTPGALRHPTTRSASGTNLNSTPSVSPRYSPSMWNAIGRSARKVTSVSAAALTTSRPDGSCVLLSIMCPRAASVVSVRSRR